MPENNQGKWGIGTLVAVIGGILGIGVAIITVYNFLSPPASGNFLEASVDSGSTGVYVTYTAVIEGYKGQECPVTYMLYYAQSDSKVPNPAWHEVDAGGMVPDRSKDQGSDEFLVPSPPERGQYYVRLKLYPPGGPEGGALAMDYIDSQVFTIF